MNYELTMQGLIKAINTELKTLIGKNPQKEGGISLMVENAIDNIGVDFLSYGIEVKGCRLEMYVGALDRNIEFATISPTYKRDKRTSSKLGNYLESIEVKMEKEIPMNISVLDASQWIAYNEAKDIFNRLKKEQDDLLIQYRKNLEGMRIYQEIMKYEAYDGETKTKAEKASLHHSPLPETLTWPSALSCTLYARSRQGLAHGLHHV